MAYGYTLPRPGAGPFGYTLGDLSSRTPEERDEFERELGDLENKLQWGFEPGRWAKGSAWHGEDWPEAKLLSGGELAGMYGQRAEVEAETQDFRATLGEANKVWKREAGLNSTFLPALASLPRHEQQRVRQQSKKFRTLIAFGETPDRWEWEIKNLAKNGHLLDPEADTERLMGLWENRETLIPHLDATDHALDYLDTVEAEAGADVPDAPADGSATGGYTPSLEPGTGPQGGGTDGTPGEFPGLEPPWGEYPPIARTGPTPHVMSPEYLRWLAVPSTPWSRLAEGWRRAWTRLGPVYRRPEDFPGRRYLPDSTVEPAVDRGPYGGGAASADPDGWVRNAYHRHVPGQEARSQPLPWIEPPEGSPEAAVELLGAEPGDSAASTQPANGPADNPSTDGPAPTSPGGEGNETPAPGKPAPDVNPYGGDSRPATGGVGGQFNPRGPSPADRQEQSQIGELRRQRTREQQALDTLLTRPDLSNAAKRQAERFAREKIANTDGEIRTLEQRVAQIRAEAEAGKQRAAADRTYPVPAKPDGSVDNSQLAPGQLYKTRDGTLFVHDGDGFREARRTGEADARGLTYKPLPDPGSVLTYGHPGAPETPDQIRRNVAELGEASGRGFYMDQRRLETLADQARGVEQQLDIARRIDPEGRNPKTGRLQAQYNGLMGEMRQAYGSAIKEAAPETVGIDDMAGRMKWPGRAEHVQSKLVRGASNVGSKALKGLATGSGSYDYARLRAMEALERGGDLGKVDLSQFKESDWPTFGRFLNAQPEERVRMKQEIVDGINAVPEGLLYRGGEGLSGLTARKFPTSQKYEGEFLTSKLPEGTGKAAVYAGVGWGGGPVAATLVASQELAGHMFEDALKHDATLEQAFRARDLGQALGMIEAVPIVPMLNKLAPEVRGQFLRPLMDAMKSGTEAGVEEAWKVLGENLIASKVVAYDPERKVYEGVIGDAKVSFTAGGTMQAIGAAIANR